ncbi:MAG: hypothetical protein ACI88G_000420 [Woeseiaceae bacterium]|jgi:hypothetical protein
MRQRSTAGWQACGYSVFGMFASIEGGGTTDGRLTMVDLVGRRLSDQL